jgi:1,4-dihydroxy-2-naphthoate polyprenyltransferase
MKNFHPWLLAIRPKTLSASLAPTLVGSALAFKSDHLFSLWLFVFILLAILFLQIATNLINDLIDFEKGTDTAERIGPTRVTQSGLISKSTVKKMAVVSLVGATICIIPLVIKGGIPILIIGIISLFLAYAYTGGPFPLSYTGFGDIFVFLFFGVVAVASIYFLQTNHLSFSAFVDGTQIGLLATVLIAINNLRDRAQDIKANKKTLAVRFGEKFAKTEIVLLIICSFVLQLYWLKTSVWAFALPLLTLPLGIKIIRGTINNPPSSFYNSLLAIAGTLQLSFSALLSLGLLLS